VLSRGQQAAVAAGTLIEFPIGAPGSGVGRQVSDTVAQPDERSTDRVRERVDGRRRRRR